MCFPRVIVVAVALLAAFASRPGRAAPPGEAEIEAAVERLGSSDVAEREKAAEFLWAAGAAAERALREAAAGDDLETARRAKSILQSLEFGLTPQTPPTLRDLIAQYRAGGQPGAKQAAVNALAQQGAAGVRVLLKLWQDEPDRQLRQMLSQVLVAESRGAAALLIAEGNFDLARRLLETAAADPDNERTARDLAAFLLLHGGLDERAAALRATIARAGPAAEAKPDAKPHAPPRDDERAPPRDDMRPEAHDDEAADAGPPDAPPPADVPGVGPGGVGAPAPAAVADARASAQLLTFLLRAKGDLAAARQAATTSGDDGLIESLTIESGDWAEMARRAARWSTEADSVEELGFAAAYHRLAGDRAGLDAVATKIADLGRARPDQAGFAAEALFLNDRPDEGLRLLLDRGSYLFAVQILGPRMQFAELMRIAEKAAADRSPERTLVAARAAIWAKFVGDLPRARALFDRASSEAGAAPSMSVRVALFEVATALGDEARAAELLAAGLAPRAKGNDEDGSVGPLLERAGYGPGERAEQWWEFLRRKYRKEPVPVTLGRLKSLLNGSLPAPEMEAMARAAEADLGRANVRTRTGWLEMVGETLIAAGYKDSARAFLRHVVDDFNLPLAAQRLGDLAADAGRWDEAAAAYGRAWELDRTRPVPLFLRGWATSKLPGQETQGRATMDLAHVLPLGEAALRHELFLELDRRGLADDARRERDLIIRTGPFLSWHVSDALRRTADEAYEARDFERAADLWDRAFLNNQRTDTVFSEPWANFAMPALMHRCRAMALIGAGKLKEASAEADLCLLYSPGETDALIDFVTELDRLGHKPEADALYARATAPYRQLCKEFPNSAQLHNQFAWAACKCRRDLDEALAHARRAAELEPTSTAILDTLAETHYQRGEVPSAIEAMNKCVELEPKVQRHREQLERFKKGSP